VGRLKPGQKARVRLDAFPWTQYGSISGHVDRIASEPREGLVRVEVVLDEASSRRIPYEHGLNGSIEVAVEQATPFTLMLRAIGKAAGSAPSALGETTQARAQGSPQVSVR
jgi:membrane fusion protein (multidrug efflux system)